MGGDFGGLEAKVSGVMVECRKNRIGGHATHGAQAAVQHRVAEIAQEVHLLFFVCVLGDAVDGFNTSG